MNSSLEENIQKPYPTQNDLYQAFFEFKKNISLYSLGVLMQVLILGIYSMAKEAIKKKVADSDEIKYFLDKKDVAGLAEIMKVDVIHISEWEQIEPKDPNKFKDM